MPKSPIDQTLRSGGNAAAGGMAFQASVAAQFSIGLLTERPIDPRLHLGEASPISIRCETEAPVDDILIETSKGGYVFVQAKTTLDLSTQLGSGLGSAVQQAVRLWIACSEGTGKRGWDKSLNQSQDRIVFAVGPTASDTISVVLSAALERYRDATSGDPTEAQRTALERFFDLINNAWKHIAGREPSNSERDGLVRLIWILQFDFDGADQIASVEMLRHVVGNPSDAEQTLQVLRQSFLKLMTARRGVDAVALRSGLVELGVKLSAPPSYLQDVQTLAAYSDRIRSHLESYERTAVHQFEAKIKRRCTAAVLQAAEHESLLLVGEPGAGKSAVVSAAAASFRKDGRTVIELAVDRLPVASIDGLSKELELSHSLVSVLRNWPGDEPAFLFIDALDATRGGQSEAVFRSLITQVLELPGQRWRVIASIRSFDLRMGQRFKALFAGKPPNKEFADPSFGSVRHISIPHWDDDELRQIEEQIPPIKIAFERGGARLRSLAAVPFNTRLLADLLSSGVSAADFGDVTTQVGLLGLYWSRRVEQHSAAGELCLREAVSQMVATRGLRAERLTVAKIDPSGLQSLLAESVLVTVAGDRYVAFRHHILFDYAASRVYLDAADADRTAQLLKSESALGLMLGPALVFGLQNVWATEPSTHRGFWNAVVRFVGDSECDPIIRSVAARVGCELPSIGSDFDGLLGLIESPAHSDKVAKTIPHLIGSLSVRVEDKNLFPVPAWCYLAEKLSRFIDQTAWPLRTLLFILIGRQTDDRDFQSLGSAARRLFAFGLTQERGGPLVNAAIGFVGDTFSTNRTASKSLLQKLFEPDRFNAHGHEDIPWLTRKVSQIVESDPDFVISTYANVFAGTITDTGETSLGNSRILPLISNKRQDYEMAQWSLAEYFPTFLEKHPREASIALIEAMKGYVDREHPVRDSTRTFSLSVNGRKVQLIQDWSYIWASDPETEHGDNALKLAVAFVKQMSVASDADLVAAANEFLERNSLGVLWSRLMLIGARRIDVLGKLLWPYASQPEFLTSADTMKDSVDVVAAGYPLQTEATRASFERKVLGHAFPDSADPEGLRKYMLRRIFGGIGRDSLTTQEAKDALTNALAQPDGEVVNDRPFRSGGVTVGSSEDHWWLKEQGVDVERPANAKVLQKTKALKDEFSGNKREFSTSNFSATLDQLIDFIAEIDASQGVHDRVRRDAVGVFGESLSALVNSDEKAAVASEGRIRQIVAQTARLATSEGPEVSADTEENFGKSASWGSPAPRVDAAHLALVMARASSAAFKLLRGTILALLEDAHPAVRMAIASHINLLWETDRSFMWELADHVVANEKNPEVLRFFANGVLGRLVWAAPAEVERTVLALQEVADGGKRGLAEEIGGLIGLLWIGSGRQKAKIAIQDWLTDVKANQEFIEHAVTMLRGNVVVGYDKPEERATEVRLRSHQLANWVVDATGDQFKAYLALADHTPEDQSRATACAKVINHVGNQFYFSSGAFRHGNDDGEAGLRNQEQKRLFLSEVGPILWKISDVATPGTLHYLIELFEFLIPADPPKMFDMVAHALLGAGKAHGYQFESLGADRVVEIVGRFLADNRNIFEDDARRHKLIECLDAFIEAGWPSARRLLYRLPELLQ